MVGKYHVCFTRKLKEKGTFIKHALVPSNNLLASYTLMNRVMKCKKPHHRRRTDSTGCNRYGKTLWLVNLWKKCIQKCLYPDSNYQSQNLAHGQRPQWSIRIWVAAGWSHDSNKDTHLICYILFIDGKLWETFSFVKVLLQMQRLKTCSRSLTLYEWK